MQNDSFKPIGNPIKNNKESTREVKQKINGTPTPKNEVKKQICPSDEEECQ